MTEQDELQLSQWIDGELPEDAVQVLRIRIEHEPDLRAAMDAFKTLDEASREAFPRISFAAPARTHRRSFRFSFPAVAAMVLLCAGIAWGAVELVRWMQTDASAPVVATQEAVTPVDNAPQMAVAPVETVSNESVQTAATTAFEDAVFAGVVMDPDGKPIRGAKIFAVGRGDDLWGEGNAEHVYASVDSNAAGEFSMPLPDEATLTVIAAHGYAPATIHDVPVFYGCLARVHVRLNAVSPIAGVVFGPDDQPVSGAAVVDADGREEVALARTASRDDGGFSIPMPKGGGGVIVTHPEFGRATGYMDRFQQPIKVWMHRTGTLRARVTRGGLPVSGAHVRVLSNSEHRVSGEDGWVEFAKLDANEQYALVARLETGEMTDRPIGSTLVPTDETVTCELAIPERYPATLTGVVLGPNGEPAAGATVGVEHPDHPENPRMVRANEHGEYQIALEAGENTIYTYRPELREVQFDVSTRGTLQVGGGQSHYRHDLKLATRPRKRVIVKNAEGAPVANVKLVVGSRHSKSMFWNITTNAGVFEYTGRLGQAMMLDESETLVFPIGQEQTGDTIEAVLETPALRLEGVIVDNEGNPVADARVSAIPSDRRLYEQWASSAMSDANGRVVLEPVGDLDYRIWADAPGYVEANFSRADTSYRPSADAVSFEIVLVRMQSNVSGTLRYADGKPAINTQIEFTITDSVDYLGELPSGYEDNRFSGAFGTDGLGEFRAALPAGTYAVRTYVSKVGEVELGSVAAPSQGVSFTIPMPAPEEFSEEAVDDEAFREYIMNSGKQMGLVFKMFAGENEGQNYPPLSGRFGQFTPRMDKLYPEYVGDSSLAALVGGKLSTEMVYFGYFVTNEAEALAFLDAYEVGGPESLTESEVVVQTSGGEEVTLYRLSEETSSALSEESGNARIQSETPVMWEMPGEHAKPGGVVLFMDGHVEWVELGTFPYTEAILSRIEAVQAQGVR